MMSHHGHGSKHACPMCDWMPGEGTVFDHVILRHGEELYRVAGDATERRDAELEKTI